MYSNKLQYWNAKYPFKDFLLVSSKKKLTEDKVQNTKDKLQGINLNIKSISKYGNIYNYLIDENQSLDINNKDIIFSGMNVYDNKFYFGEDDVDKLINRDFINSCGMFTAISIDRESIIAVQDDFGCGSLFYAQYDDAIYVSNRYHLLLLTLSWMGFEGELDIAKAMYWIYFTNNNSRMHTYNGHDKMDIKGVYSLPINKYIYIGSQGWEIREKVRVTNALKGISDKSYEKLIDEGVKDINSTIEAIINHKRFNKYIVEISGGFDSRVTFSAISKMKDKINKLEALIYDTSSQGDVKIGNALRKLADIDLYNESVEKIYPMTINEQLQITRSYLMGTNSLISLIGRSNKDEDINSIVLSGAMGEYYRGERSELYSEILSKDNSSTKVFCKNLVDISAKFVKQDSHKQLLYELFEDVFENTVIGDTLEEKIMNHQIFFNLRFHFCINAHVTFNNKPRYSPLMSINLLTASKMLQEKERTSERFMLELTERINPLLAWAEYGDKRVDTKTILNNIKLKHERYRNTNTELDFNIEDWKLQNQINLEYLGKLRREFKEVIDKDFYKEWKNLNEYIKEDTIKAYESLSRHIGIYNEEFIDYINKEVKDERELKIFYSKVMSLLDQIEIFSQI